VNYVKETHIEGVCEQGTEENIWLWDGRIDEMVGEIAQAKWSVRDLHAIRLNKQGGQYGRLFKWEMVTNF
jgi:hypothetical protein